MLASVRAGNPTVDRRSGLISNVLLAQVVAQVPRNPNFGTLRIAQTETCLNKPTETG